MTEISTERPVWGFSNDDMHDPKTELGHNWNIMLLPELSSEWVRRGMMNGMFFFVYAPLGHDGPIPPVIRSITVNSQKGTIHIDVPGYESIEWISEGKVVHWGDRVSLSELPSLGGYIRAVIHAADSGSVEDKGMPIPEFRKVLKEKMDLLKMDHNFAGRYLNDGFSGGEKKRAEILQMATLKPEIAVLDETDSGLDIDALRIVAEGVNALTGSDLGVLLITHYQRLRNYIKPDFVHIMLDGRIVESGGPDLALHLEEQGYEWVREKYEETTA